jgi:hypothetical protein
VSVVVGGGSLCDSRRRGAAMLHVIIDDVVVCAGVRAPFGAGVSLGEELATPYRTELPACAVVSHPSYSHRSLEPCLGYEASSIKVSTYQVH